MPEEAAPDCENYKGGHCMSNTNQYDVVWPLTPSTVQGAKLAKTSGYVGGKVVAELGYWVFKGRYYVPGI